MNMIILFAALIGSFFTIQSVAAGVPECSGAQQLSTIDATIIFHYKAPDTCIGPAIKNYSHIVYSAKAFDLSDFMKTAPEGQAIIFAKSGTRDELGKAARVVTLLVVARDEGGIVRGWNVIVNKGGAGVTERTFFMDILNDPKVEMLSADATFVLLAEIDSIVLRFHRVPENIFYETIEPYIQYLLGLAEGKGV